MAITLVGTQTNSGTTVTIPTHQAGDLILIWAMHGGATTIPTLPVGYESVITKTESTATALGGRLGWKTATSTSDTSGTWTNATEMCCHVYRPSSGNTLGIGASAANSTTTTTLNYPALTMVDSSGNSWVAGFSAASTTSQGLNTNVPSGMSNESSVLGATYAAAGADTEGGVSSWSSTNVTLSAAGHAISAVVEILLLPKNAGSSNLSNLYQCAPMEGLFSTLGLTCQNLKIPMPNPSGSGNCVVLCISYPNGTTLTITDNLDTWPGSPSVHANAGSGNMDSAIYVLPNCTSGQRLVNVAFSTAPDSVQYCIYEFYGIATSSPVNGSSSTAFTAGPGLACGSFTPTNNNSNGGNLLLAYYAKGDLGVNQSAFPTRIWQLGSFSPVDADVAPQGAQGANHASSLYLQATSAAINPKATAIGDTDHWNSCVIALAISSGAGTAPQSGIRINKFNSMTGFTLPVTASFGLHCPCAGNLRVLANADPNITYASVTVVDSEGNTWTADGNDAGFWYLENATRNDNLVVTVTNYGGDQTSTFFLYDISGAAPNAFISSLQTSEALATTFTLSPSPTSDGDAPGLMIACIGLGTGPALSVTAPAAAIWTVPNYTGKTDADSMNNADFQAHYYFTGTGSQTWSGTCSVATSADLGGFIAFLGASTSTLPGIGTFTGTAASGSTTWTGTSTWPGIGTLVEANETSKQSAQATLGGIGTLVEANETSKQVASATLGGVGTIVDSETGVYRPGTATLGGVGTLVEANERQIDVASATFGGIGALVEANETSKQSAQATLGGVGTLNAVAAQPGSSATLGGVGTLVEANESQLAVASSVLGGVGTLVEANESQIAVASATLGGVGTLTDSETGVARPGVATLGAVGALNEANETSLQSAQAVLGGVGTLGAVAVPPVAGTVLGGIGTLIEGSEIQIASGLATLDSEWNLTGIGTVIPGASGGAADDDSDDPAVRRRRKWLADHDLELPKVRIVRERKPAVTQGVKNQEAPQLPAKTEAPPPLERDVHPLPTITLPPSLLSTPALKPAPVPQATPAPKLPPVQPPPEPTFSQRISEIAALSAAQRAFTERLSAIAAERTAKRQRDRDEDDVAAILGMM